MGLLELLRLALVIVVALLLNQPEIVQEFRPEEKPSIAVLWDASPSMETRDDSRCRGTKGAPAVTAWPLLSRSAQAPIAPQALPARGCLVLEAARRPNACGRKWSSNPSPAPAAGAARSCTARWPPPRPSSRTWSASC